MWWSLAPARLGCRITFSMLTRSLLWINLVNSRYNIIQNNDLNK